MRLFFGRFALRADDNKNNGTRERKKRLCTRRSVDKQRTHSSSSKSRRQSGGRGEKERTKTGDSRVLGYCGNVYAFETALLGLRPKKNKQEITLTKCTLHTYTSTSVCFLLTLMRARTPKLHDAVVPRRYETNERRKSVCMHIADSDGYITVCMGILHTNAISHLMSVFTKNIMRMLPFFGVLCAFPHKCIDISRNNGFSSFF